MKIKNRSACTLSFLIIFISGTKCLADDKTPKSPDELARGDRLVNEVTIDGVTPAFGDDKDKKIIPARSVLWIDGDGQPNSPHKDDLRIHISCYDGNIVFGCKDLLPQYLGGTKNLQNLTPIKTSTQNNIASLDTEYYVDKATLNELPSSIYGPVYGALIIPYKVHLSDHTITGTPTIGAYAGIQYGKGYASLAWVVSAGLSAVNGNNQKDASSNSDTSTKTGFTASTGAIITLDQGQKFQIGILYGSDWVGNDANYRYNGKPWLAISFGTNLTN